MMIQIYDNGGESIDRYTVVIEDEGYGAYYGMSENPFDPQGFNQYGGEAKDLDYSNLGKHVNYYNLPRDVQKAIAQRLPADK